MSSNSRLVDMDERRRGVGVEWTEEQTPCTQQTFIVVGEKNKNKKNKNKKSEVKQEKKMSKTESRFKSKLESLKKLQHSATNNSAVERARAFFRSLELKHVGNSEQSSSSSSSRRRAVAKAVPVSSSISSSSSSSVVDDTHPTGLSTTTSNSSFHTKTPPISALAKARIIRVINPNPRDMIVHRVLHGRGDDEPSISSSHFAMHQSYTQSLSIKNSNPNPPRPLLVHKQQNNEEITDRNENFSLSIERFRDRPNSPSFLPNFPHINHLHHSRASPLNNDKNAHQLMSASLYTYRPLVCRQFDSSSPHTLMSSSFHEQYHPSSPPPMMMTRTLSSSFSPPSSMSTWTQSVRRLNTEYSSTINALEQAKESLTYALPNNTISSYANLVARGISDLSSTETKKSLGVTFCLKAPASVSPLQTKKLPVQPCPTISPTMFCKPKLVRPMELETFIPSLPKLEPISTAIEKNEKRDSISNIIKKFNNLNLSSPMTTTPAVAVKSVENKSTFDGEQQEKKNSDSSVTPPLPTKEEIDALFPSPTIPLRVHFDQVEPSSVTTYELEEIPYESPPPPFTSSSSSSSSISEDSTSSTNSSTNGENESIMKNSDIDNHPQEETTYTVETFYKSPPFNPEIIKNSTIKNLPHVVVIRENTTEEQFNLAQKNSLQKTTLYHIPRYTSANSPSKIPSLITTPLLTYLNLNIKQSTPVAIEKTTIDNYRSVQPSTHAANCFISDGYNGEDDETVSDVVTINPHTHSPPPSSVSHRLISTSSSSSSSTASSASTVLLTGNNATLPPPPLSSSLSQSTSTTPNGRLLKTPNKTVSQLPKRTTTPISNVSRLKQPSKTTIPPPSKLKPPSSTATITKLIKPMIVNSTTPIRKQVTMMNQPTTTIVNKTTQQQSTVATTKKQQSTNGISMAEQPNLTDPTLSTSKSRVRSMVNQLNAASSSSSPRPTTPSSILMIGKKTPITPTAIPRRPSSNIASEPTPTTKQPPITSPNRPSLQRALTINHSSPTTSPTPPSNIPSAYRRKTPLIRSTSNVKDGLLRWCQVQVAGYPNVSVTNLSSSWSDGLAFCALIHHFFPDAFDFNQLSSNNRQDNFELAFRIAEERAGIPRLLDVADMLLMGNTPDYKCIFTYLNSFLAKIKDIHPLSSSSSSKNGEHH